MHATVFTVVHIDLMCDEYVFDTFVSTSKWPALQYATMMFINPIDTDAGVNYTRVVEKLFNHTLLHNDNYISKNLVELHIYLESNDIQYCDGILKNTQLVLKSGHFYSLPHVKP